MVRKSDVTKADIIKSKNKLLEKELAFYKKAYDRLEYLRKGFNFKSTDKEFTDLSAIEFKRFANIVFTLSDDIVRDFDDDKQDNK